MPDPGLQTVRSSPSFKVLVNGNVLPEATALSILTINASDYVEGAAVFTLTINDWDSSQQSFKGIDTQLDVGTQVEIRVGYVENLISLFTGEVTAIEPDFPDDGSPVLKIHGYDLLQRFRRGKNTRTFTNMTDSQVAGQIARTLQLNAQTDDTQVVHEYLLQNNQTDIDFLLDRARRIRYEVVVQGRTLYFRKAANDKSQVTALTYGLTLKSFYPRLNTLNQVNEVVVQGWNPKTKQVIAGTAQKGDETTLMGGSTLGVTATRNAFFDTQTLVVNHALFSNGEALQIAKGKFNEMTLEYIKGEGVAVGDPSIRSGAVISLQGLGTRFSGSYYVTSTTHMIAQTGYTTKFTAVRNST
jgi:phage protein D